MREPFGRRKEVFSVASHGVYLMGVLIEGATHRHRQGSLIKLRILNRPRDAIRLEVSGPTGNDVRDERNRVIAKEERTGRTRTLL